MSQRMADGAALSAGTYPGDEVRERRCLHAAARRVGACLLVIVALAPACTRPRRCGSGGPSGSNHRIVVHADQAVARLRSAPPRHERARLARAGLRDRRRGPAPFVVASGTTLLRLPGGSWSNDYDWLGCELGDPQRCDWHWAMRPSDFLGLLESTGLPAMWTVSINGTAEEAAAAGGVLQRGRRRRPPDRHGPQWPRLADGRALGAAPGRARPPRSRARFSYWEIGNEVYGAVQSAGPRLRVLGLGGRLDL